MSREKYVDKVSDIFKGLAFLLVTAIFGVCGFIVSHLNDIDQKQLIMSVAGLLILAVIACFVARYLKRLLDEMENM